MKLLTERAQVRAVIEYSRQQVAERTGHKCDRALLEAFKKAAALDPETATAADVGVTQRACTECGHVGWDIVQLGEEPDYESDTAWICLACLRNAVALVESEALHG